MKNAIMRRIVALALLGGTLGLCATLMFVTPDEISASLISLLGGALAAQLGAVVGYYLHDESP